MVVLDAKVGAKQQAQLLWVGQGSRLLARYSSSAWKSRRPLPGITADPGGDCSCYSSLDEGVGVVVDGLKYLRFVCVEACWHEVQPGTGTARE